jgi:hypothetical protein
LGSAREERGLGLYFWVSPGAFYTDPRYESSLCDRSSNKMPIAVRQALAFAALKYGKKTEAEAKEYVRALESRGRLFEECWS